MISGISLLNNLQPVRFNRLLFLLGYLVLILFLDSCAENNHESKQEDDVEWKGAFETFENTFEKKPSLDSTDHEEILYLKGDGQPFSGSIERNSTSRISLDEYDNGRLEGVSVRKSADGSWVEAKYKDGKLHGKMTFYGTNGEIRSVMYYQNGNLIPPKAAD